MQTAVRCYTAIFYETHSLERTEIQGNFHKMEKRENGTIYFTESTVEPSSPKVFSISFSKNINKNA